MIAASMLAQPVRADRRGWLIESKPHLFPSNPSTVIADLSRRAPPDRLHLLRGQHLAPDRLTVT